MKRLKVVLGVFVFIGVGLGVAWFGFLKPKPKSVSDIDRAQITLMPLPAELKLHSNAFILDSDFGYQIEGLTTPKVERALQRFFGHISQATAKTIQPKLGKHLQISVENETAAYPTILEDESYTLSITKRRIRLHAPTETGVLHGLETLLQLIRNENGQSVIPALKIQDQPRFAWRGLMIDVSRHWIPKQVILRNLDAMAQLKMNVLHWHLSDYQGFRVESIKFPKLHKMGSNGNFYTQEDIREVVQYAADRGIRVVPEFDVPGHATSILAGYPDLGSAPGPYSMETRIGIHTPVLNPTDPKVYYFLDQFIGEMTTLFPDTYFHIGGDEVNDFDWKNNSNIQAFMQDNHINDSHELQAYFNTRLQKIVAKYGKIMMGWDEIMHPDLQQDKVLIHSWRNHKSLWEAAQNGNQALLSSGYYLDHKQSAAFHYDVDPMIIPNAVNISIDPNLWESWKLQIKMDENVNDGNLYVFGEEKNLRGVVDFMNTATAFETATFKEGVLEFDIESRFGTIRFELQKAGNTMEGALKLGLFQLDVNGKKNGGNTMADGEPLPVFDKIEPLTETAAANILGGEACMWTEMADSLTITSRIWPRAAAIAEKLWSPQALTDDTNDLYRRLMAIDTLLTRRGLSHLKSTSILIQNSVNPEYYEPLESLVELLQEDVLFNRLSIYEKEYNTEIPLNRMVDAARPESYIAYRFNQLVKRWIASGDEKDKKGILLHLEQWRTLYKKLKPAFENHPEIREVAPHARNLSELAQRALEKIDPNFLNAKSHSTVEKQLTDAQKAHGGTILAVLPGLTQLLQTDNTP